MDQRKNQKNTLLLRAYFYLRFRLRTIHEMRLYLQKKAKNLSIPEEIIQEALEQLIADNYLNDEKFTQEYMRSRSNSNPKGNYAINQELLQKGVSDEIIKKILANSETDEVNRALFVLQKKQNRLSHLVNREKFQKALALLQRRGFSFDTAQKAYALFIQNKSSTMDI